MIICGDGLKILVMLEAVVVVVAPLLIVQQAQRHAMLQTMASG